MDRQVLVLNRSVNNITIHAQLFLSSVNSLLYTEYQCFHIFLCLKFYFPFPFIPLETFHIVNSIFSHYSTYSLHPRISKPSLLLLLLLSIVYHIKIICGSFSLFIPRRWPYQIRCLIQHQIFNNMFFSNNIQFISLVIFSWISNHSIPVPQRLRNLILHIPEELSNGQNIEQLGKLSILDWLHTLIFRRIGWGEIIKEMNMPFLCISMQLVHK